MMERTLRDDVLVVLLVLTGAALGALVFGADAAVVQGLAIGGVAMIVLPGALRFLVRLVGVREHP